MSPRTWLILAAIGVANAHMQLRFPLPIKSILSSKLQYGSPDFDAQYQPDYSMTAPLAGDGSNYPCKGYHLADSHQYSVTSFIAGGTYNITLMGATPTTTQSRDGSAIAQHGGGSCQISISYDNGQSFKVIKSILGCPIVPVGSPSVSFDFTIPEGAPSADTGNPALLAWSWNNKIGNREMYMNCARVTISNPRQATQVFDTLPSIFVANVGNPCHTIEGCIYRYPDPGTIELGPGYDTQSCSIPAPDGKTYGSGIYGDSAVCRGGAATPSSSSTRPSSPTTLSSSSTRQSLSSSTKTVDRTTLPATSFQTSLRSSLTTTSLTTSSALSSSSSKQRVKTKKTKTKTKKGSTATITATSTAALSLPASTATSSTKVTSSSPEPSATESACETSDHGKLQCWPADGGTQYRQCTWDTWSYRDTAPGTVCRSTADGSSIYLAIA